MPEILINENQLYLAKKYVNNDKISNFPKYLLYIHPDKLKRLEDDHITYECREAEKMKNIDYILENKFNKQIYVVKIMTMFKIIDDYNNEKIGKSELLNIFQTIYDSFKNNVKEIILLLEDHDSSLFNIHNECIYSPMTISYSHDTYKDNNPKYMQGNFKRLYMHPTIFRNFIEDVKKIGIKVVTSFDSENAYYYVKHKLGY